MSERCEHGEEFGIEVLDMRGAVLMVVVYDDGRCDTRGRVERPVAAGMLRDLADHMETEHAEGA